LLVKHLLGLELAKWANLRPSALSGQVDQHGALREKNALALCGQWVKAPRG
jgi:hypothetical protein